MSPKIASARKTVLFSRRLPQYVLSPPGHIFELKLITSLKIYLVTNEHRISSYEKHLIKNEN